MAVAPIVLFVFNRPIHTERLIASLGRNRLAKDSDLFVYSDGPRCEADELAVCQVRSLLHKITGFKSVQIENHSHNQGLAASVISGVTSIAERYGKAIVLEDDLELSPNFLAFMNIALEQFQKERCIWSIGGYSPPFRMPTDYSDGYYLSYRGCTWGWATWWDRWRHVDWEISDFASFSANYELIERFNRGGEDMFHILQEQIAGRVDSWGIRWDYAHFKNNAYCVRPVRSIVRSTGNDGSGIHCGMTNRFDVELDIEMEALQHLAGFEAGRPDQRIASRFASFYDGRTRSVFDTDFYIRRYRSAKKKLGCAIRKCFARTSRSE
jgi:hypothetical protein